MIDDPVDWLRLGKRSDGFFRLPIGGDRMSAQREDEVVVVYHADGTHTDIIEGCHVSSSMSPATPGPNGTRPAMVLVYDDQGRLVEAVQYAAVWTIRKKRRWGEAIE